jgi:hypothetical protein
MSLPMLTARKVAAIAVPAVTSFKGSTTSATKQSLCRFENLFHRALNLSDNSMAEGAVQVHQISRNLLDELARQRPMSWQFSVVDKIVCILSVNTCPRAILSFQQH